MQHVESKYPPGMVLVATGLQPRYYEYVTSADRLKAPTGSRYLIERSCDATSNFNSGLKKLSDKDQWVWFLGDDHSFHEDTLLRFLAHDVDIVVPISPTKVAPFVPCVIHGPTDGQIWHPNMPLYTWDELSGDGLMALPMGDFIGQAGMLVKRHVLDAIGYPWFKAGQLDPGRMTEDLAFCREVQQRGYTVHVDRDVIFDHWMIVGVTARKHDGQYVPALKSGDKVMILPDAKGVKKLDFGTGNPRVKWRVPLEEDYRASLAPEEPVA